MPANQAFKLLASRAGGDSRLSTSGFIRTKEGSIAKSRITAAGVFFDVGAPGELHAVARAVATVTAPLDIVYYDSRYADVQLLLHMDGTNGGTTFTDTGPLARSVTATGGGTTSTAQKRFGSAAYNSPNLSNYLTVGGALWAPPSTGYTIEAFVRIPALPTNNFTLVWVPFAVQVGVLQSTRKVYISASSGGQATFAQSTTVLGVNVWTHIVGQVDNGNVSVWIDGVREYFAALDNPGPLDTSTQPIYLMGDNATFLDPPNTSAVGVVDELRITYGPRYSGTSFPAIDRPFADSAPPVGGAKTLAALATAQATVTAAFPGPPKTLAATATASAWANLDTPGPGDPAYSTVRFLVRANGPAGTNPRDETSLAHAIADPFNDRSKIIGSPLRFGTNVIDVRTGHGIAVDNVSTLDVGNLDFDLEWWMYTASSISTLYVPLLENFGLNAGFAQLTYSGDILVGRLDVVLYDTSNNVILTALLRGVSFPTASWHHVVLSRSGGAMTLTVNGAVFVITTTLGTTALRKTGFRIPGQGNISYLDDVRLSVGPTRYPRSLLPTAQAPISSPSDPVYANVSLLLRGNGANNGTTFTDNSTNAYTPTVVGTVKTSTAQSKYSGSSIYFDGSASRLQYAAATPLLLGDSTDSTFNIDAWFRLDDLSNTYCLLSKTNFANGAFYFPSYSIDIAATTGQVSATIGTSAPGGTVITSGAATVTAGVWNHVALVMRWPRDSKRTELYLNGVLMGGVTAAIPYDLGFDLQIGHNDKTGAYFKGYINDLRITKNSSRLELPVTPPTAQWDNFAAPGGVTLAASAAALATVTAAAARNARLATTPTALATFTPAQPGTVQQLANTAAALAAVTANLNVTTGGASKTFDAVPTAVATVTAALATGKLLAAVPAGLAALTAGVAKDSRMQTSAAALATVTQALPMQDLRLATQPQAVATNTGAVALGTPLAASAAGLATVTATIPFAPISIAAAATATASGLAAINQTIQAAAANISTATVLSAGLATPKALAALAASTASSTTDSAASISLATAPAALATATVALGVSKSVASSATAAAVASADLFIAKALNTAAAAQASVTAIFSVAQLMAAVAAAQAESTAALTTVYGVPTSRTIILIDDDPRGFVVTRENRTTKVVT